MTHMHNKIPADFWGYNIGIDSLQQGFHPHEHVYAAGYAAEAGLVGSLEWSLECDLEQRENHVVNIDHGKTMGKP